MKLIGIIIALLLINMPASAFMHRGCQPYSGTPLYQSLYFTDGWTSFDSTLSTNTLTSPICPTTSAATLTEDTTASAQHKISNFPSVTLTSAHLYTLTLFAKRVVGTRNFQIQFFNVALTSGFSGGFDLNTCTVNVAYSAFGTWTNGTDTGSVVNGYCQMVMTFTPGANDAPDIILLMGSGTNNNYNGDGSSSIGLYGLDLR